MEPTIFAGFLLTGLLLAKEPTPEGREAAQYAALATYHQSGLDKMIEPRLQYLERRYISEDVKSFGIVSSIIYRFSVDHTIVYGWSF